MRYVTFDHDGNLTGCFQQDLVQAHEDGFIVIDDAQATNWPAYRANSDRDGVELIPIIPPTADEIKAAQRAAIQVQIDERERATLENRGSREFHIAEIVDIATKAAPGLGVTPESILAGNPYYRKLIAANAEIVALRVAMVAI